MLALRSRRFALIRPASLSRKTASVRRSVELTDAPTRPIAITDCAAPGLSIK